MSTCIVTVIIVDNLLSGRETANLMLVHAQIMVIVRGRRQESRGHRVAQYLSLVSDVVARHWLLRRAFSPSVLQWLTTLCILLLLVRGFVACVRIRYSLALRWLLMSCCAWSRV